MASLSVQLLMLSLSVCNAYDVLMVIGGMYLDQGVTYTLTSVEIIGLARVCQSFSLPQPRHSHFGGRLADRAIVCGGNDGTYERAECFVLKDNANGRWAPMIPDLGQPLIFAAASGDGGHNFYVIGGRRYDFTKSKWEYLPEARVYNSQDDIWRSIEPLPKPIANACLLVLGSTLIFSGGAKQRYIYADEPSKVFTLNVSKVDQSWRDDQIPALDGSRMWHGCTLANIDHNICMIIAGGYYNGRATMAFPLNSLLLENGGNDLAWSRLDFLPEERQWGPALGLVAGKPTIAGSQNYGDVTIDTLNNGYYWNRDPKRRLRHKREFVVGITIPHYWAPRFCGF